MRKGKSSQVGCAWLRQAWKEDGQMLYWASALRIFSPSCDVQWAPCHGHEVDSWPLGPIGLPIVRVFLGLQGIYQHTAKGLLSAGYQLTKLKLYKLWPNSRPAGVIGTTSTACCKPGRKPCQGHPQLRCWWDTPHQHTSDSKLACCFLFFQALPSCFLSFLLRLLTASS